ncbi:MAG TPA: glutaredoxin domain-containing protein [Ktedonobacterales bacterium]|nr:glutaredoxin domain-containing protein [Ktedonobacterales bacterium]
MKVFHPFRKGADASAPPAQSTDHSSQPGDEILFYATAWCGDCFRAKRVFAKLGVAYRYIDIEQDDAAAATVMRLNQGMRRVPTIVFPDGSVLAEPANHVLADKLALYAPA